IGSIPEAIMLLGLQKIRDLVTVILVLEFFSGVRSDLVSMGTFARHSLGVAAASRLLATARRDSRSEQHFLSGLIHDVGRLALFQKCPGQMSRVMEAYESEKRNIPLVLVEKRILSFDHAEVGMEL